MRTGIHFTQLVARDGEARLFSRTGDDISRSFPEIIEAVRFDAIIDGELLIATEGDYILDCPQSNAPCPD